MAACSLGSTAAGVVVSGTTVSGRELGLPLRMARPALREAEQGEAKRLRVGEAASSTERQAARAVSSAPLSSTAGR